MKTIFNIALAGMATVAWGCVGFEPMQPDTYEGDGLPPEVDLCEGCPEDQPLRGELMLIVNTKPTDGGANFQSNFPLDDKGRFVGNALYLYDPSKPCDAGGCLAKVGNLWLDDKMGPISMADTSLLRFTVRDLAWHADKGLWGLSYDPLNDEWGLMTLGVPDWKRADNRVESVRYAFKYGDVKDPATDGCYWRQSMTGLEFVGDSLFAASAGKPGNGLDARGALFLLDPAFLAAPEHCVLPSDISQDPMYYACAPICSVHAEFEEKVGVSGDMAPGPDGDVLALVRGEMSETFPEGRHELLRVAATGDMPEPRAYGPFIDDIPAGFEIEGLARVQGALYGVGIGGTVYKITEPTAEAPGSWKFAVHDELGPQFTDPDRSLRIRGATAVVVP
ncbi:hypothetical protein OV203_24160 [Nannocystis sp. ILAH1]|uniref:hypothetical protein n=1 Tax=unclassified Nannocystis TaxID=2627009 RepID=UPI002271CBA6|nr:MULTISPECIES: hypothetical protein [unclassified Nannocystis]MCY0990257.1 hypothetical protein [Nannocystis sp. ILAH1]MCY1069454.1 hypothetical protein [Nannocystis sp. RBIL2]